MILSTVASASETALASGFALRTISFRYLAALSWCPPSLAAASAALKYTSERRSKGRLFKRISPTSSLSAGNLLMKIFASPYSSLRSLSY